ncbi:hypothetical protein DFH11DRAFT_673355 [Phellopilus nigrolimitatus]|nr:hypothetical protein DFH11DRAFT_673355 [Phellopilus nigrolimitatus]
MSGRRGRAHAHQESASRSPRYELQLPYMIFADFGEGLEIGNEVDGFMPYEEYLSTSHLRVPKESMYFIIPGNTPVIFHDEDGRELYRIDAQKYNTPTLRRRKYIIQDEFGNELYRIGNFGDRTRNDFLSSPSGGSSGSGSHSSRSKPPRVIYLNPDNGRQAQNRLR